MKLKDLRSSLRVDRRCVSLDISALISDEIVRFSDGTPAVFAGSFREGSHVIVGVDPGSGESASYEQMVDGNGRVIRVIKLPSGTSDKTRQNALDKAFDVPGDAHLIATDTDERAGLGGAPGADCSAIPVCPRSATRIPLVIHRDCKVTSLGRSLGTQFARYYTAPDPRSIEALRAVFWETCKWAVHILDPHAAARLVRLEKVPNPSECETAADLRMLRVRTTAKDGADERLNVFNLYPAQVVVCGCESPWDGARGDCATCGGLGVVWRHRLHPVLVPERGSVESLARTAARLKR